MTIETQHFVAKVNNTMLLGEKRNIGQIWPMAKPKKPPARVQFAQRLKQARERKYRHAADLARDIRMEPEAYRRWERAETEPNVTTLQLLVRKLDVSADFLVTGDLPPPPKRET